MQEKEEWQLSVYDDKGTIAMSRAKISYSEHKVVAAIGRRTGQRENILSVGLYIPPWYNAGQNRSFFKYAPDCLFLLNSRYDDPCVVIGEDFNRRDFKKAVADFLFRLTRLEEVQPLI